MNSKTISASTIHLHLSSNPTHLSTHKSLPLSQLPNTHLPKRGFWIKTSSGSHGTAAGAATVNNLYTAAQDTETFYELLGISESGTLSEIKQAYKHMALKYHPDVSPPDRTEEYTRRFIMVQEAYETLSDPETRAVYDAVLAKGLHLAFSGGRNGIQRAAEDRNRWKDRWQSQIVELKKRSETNSSRRMSWAARTRNREDGANMILFGYSILLPNQT